MEKLVNSTLVLSNVGLKSKQMKKLHALESHQSLEIKVVDSHNTINEAGATEDSDEEESDQIAEKVCKEAGLSPLVLSKGKKGKTKRDIGVHPTRKQAKGRGCEVI